MEPITDMPNPTLEGFLLGISLIAAIGVQNLFVLRQGIIGSHILLTVLAVSICDIIVIGVGTLGAGSLIASVSWLRMVAVICGVAFLLFYAARSWTSLFQGRSLELVTADGTVITQKTVIMSAVGFSFLNPQAFLDGVVLIGGLSGQYEIVADRALFGVGAGIASIVWFFTLAFGARILAPFFRKPIGAMVLDGMTGLIMCWIAWSLVRSELSILFS